MEFTHCGELGRFEHFGGGRVWLLVEGDGLGASGAALLLRVVPPHEVVDLRVVHALLQRLTDLGGLNLNSCLNLFISLFFLGVILKLYQKSSSRTGNL